MDINNILNCFPVITSKCLSKRVNLWKLDFKANSIGDFPGDPVVKTLPSNAGGAGSIPGKIPHASWPKNQNTKEKRYCNKFNKDFKNGPHQKKS